MDKFMIEAIVEAKAGMAEGNSPIGSVFVKDGEILGRGRNTLMRTSDPTAHAEMEAYRDAAQYIAKSCKPEDVQNVLAGGIIYTTMMPCPMRRSDHSLRCESRCCRRNTVLCGLGDATTYGTARYRCDGARGTGKHRNDGRVFRTKPRTPPSLQQWSATAAQTLSSEHRHFPRASYGR